MVPECKRVCGLPNDLCRDPLAYFVAGVRIDGTQVQYFRCVKRVSVEAHLFACLNVTRPTFLKGNDELCTKTGMDKSVPRHDTSRRNERASNCCCCCC